MHSQARRSWVITPARLQSTTAARCWQTVSTSPPRGAMLTWAQTRSSMKSSRRTTLPYPTAGTLWVRRAGPGGTSRQHGQNFSAGCQRRRPLCPAALTCKSITASGGTLTLSGFYNSPLASLCSPPPFTLSCWQAPAVTPPMPALYTLLDSVRMPPAHCGGHHGLCHWPPRGTCNLASTDPFSHHHLQFLSHVRRPFRRGLFRCEGGRKGGR